jgi:two-component system OmpR family response regulator
MRPAAPTATTQVVLVIDVPSGMTELVSRAEQLVNEFGRTTTRTVPGVRARKAVVVAGHTSRPVAASPYPSDALTIDRVNRDVWVDGEPVHLTFREFELLSHLAMKPGRAVSRESLMRDVWRDGASSSSRGSPAASSRTVDTHIRRLRVKLGHYERLLTTMRGQGYRFESHPDVHFVGAVQRPRPA